MPEHRPAAVIINRLWPLLLATLAAGVLGAVSPKIPAVATGFAIIWALSWRKQHRAVIAIEERDGVDVLRRGHVADRARWRSSARRGCGARCRRSTARGAS